MKNKTWFFVKQRYEKYKVLIKELMQEIFIVVGFACFCYGVYQIYHPAMWIVLGLGILKITMPGGK
jgi:hypothetical protein